MTTQPNTKCTCPSGDGSLRWPCPKHPPAAAPAEMSPEFTDTARAAIAWVLWHHQGASSPVGQPLRFALGMGADEPLPDWRIAEAKRYAAWAGATTAKFHEARAITPAAPGIDLEQFREAVAYWRDTALKDMRYENGPLHGQANEAQRLLDLIDASPKGGSDPWRGLYAPERAPNRDEYGCFYHPDIPSWDDEREESIAPLLKAQGFDLQCVPGDFSDEAMEEGGERYWQEMREWNPEPEGDGWRLVAIYDTEDGPYSMFVKPLAQAGDAEVQP